MSLESTTSEESTTSSQEGQDEDWYREAVNSSSSEEGDPSITKSKDKSKHPAVPVNKSFI